MEKRWFVVYTKSGHEGLAQRELENQGFETFFPVYEVVKPHKNRAFKRICPFFPSYIFVSFDPETERWRAIRGTRGVITLVGSGEDFVTPVPAGCVERLLTIRDERGYIDIGKALGGPILQEGDVVEILTEPWVGQCGTVFKTSQERVIVLLTLLSDTVRLVLNQGTVRRV